jgi:ketosteroid isomerase-like protein
MPSGVADDDGDKKVGHERARPAIQPLVSTSTQNRDTVAEFYRAFAARDAEGMVRCYHPTEARFSDPVFTDLRGPQIFAMWRMLTQRAIDFELTFGDVEGDETTPRVHWEAHYVFSRTKRRVHNIVEASFVFRDGKIIEHTDRFDLWRWAGQALGASGKMLGWAGFFQRTVQKRAGAELERFLASVQPPEKNSTTAAA